VLIGQLELHPAHERRHTLLVLNTFMIVIGFSHPGLIGYGGGTEQLIALSVILVGLVSYFFARAVQDRQRGAELWRTKAPMAFGADRTDARDALP
jgi:hypothetical protein